MTALSLCLLLVALLLAFAAAWQRRVDLRRQREVLRERADAAELPADARPVTLPVIDLARCLGCGTCVRECPEHGVLALAHGQATLVNPAGCVGHARCVSECPTGAVTLQAKDLGERSDVPVLDDALQAVGQEGVFLIGEVTGSALIRRAVQQGTQVAAAVAARLVPVGPVRDPQATAVHDVVIVGAGPGGLACALACHERGLEFVLVDREAGIGGTVARYPRQKLVLTDDVELPVHGRLARREYQKEELMALWSDLQRRHHLPFQGGVTVQGVARRGGLLVVATDRGELLARNVVLAVGRRGAPRRLGVPGEDRPHVAYALFDAAAYAGRQCAVVGGGDSAVEAALALSEQPGCEVTLVHRREAFHRIRQKNRERLEQRIAAGRITPMLACVVQRIDERHVELQQHAGGGGVGVALQVRADAVFVMAGGEPPSALLAASGVSCDPALRAASPGAAAAKADPGLDLRTVGLSLLLVAAALVFTLWFGDYYFASPARRAGDPQHALLRPDARLGLWFGIAATVAMLANLAYLLRRNRWFGLRLGELSTWLSAHIVTGVAAFALAMLHAALAPRATLGGFAAAGIGLLLLTGAIGRWFYAWLPRHANGRELELDVLRRELATIATAGAAGDAFAREAQAETEALLERRQWHSSWLGRVLALLGLQWDLRRTVARLRRAGGRHGESGPALAAAIARVRDVHRLALAVAHLEDLRALLATWRWLHRWLALLVVLLVVVHVVVAALHGAFAGGRPW